jgi:hypothetical protein
LGGGKQTREATMREYKSGTEMTFEMDETGIKLLAMYVGELARQNLEYRIINDKFQAQVFVVGY